MRQLSMGIIVVIAVLFSSFKAVLGEILQDHNHLTIARKEGGTLLTTDSRSRFLRLDKVATDEWTNEERGIVTAEQIATILGVASKIKFPNVNELDNVLEKSTKGVLRITKNVDLFKKLDKMMISPFEVKEGLDLTKKIPILMKTPQKLYADKDYILWMAYWRYWDRQHNRPKSGIERIMLRLKRIFNSK